MEKTNFYCIMLRHISTDREGFHSAWMDKQTAINYAQELNHAYPDMQYWVVPENAVVKGGETKLPYTRGFVQVNQ
jgi:hypothetical protein